MTHIFGWVEWDSHTNIHVILKMKISFQWDLSALWIMWDEHSTTELYDLLVNGCKMFIRYRCLCLPTNQQYTHVAYLKWLILNEKGVMTKSALLDIINTYAYWSHLNLTPFWQSTTNLLSKGSFTLHCGVIALPKYQFIFYCNSMQSTALPNSICCSVALW